MQAYRVVEGASRVVACRCGLEVSLTEREVAAIDLVDEPGQIGGVVSTTGSGVLMVPRAGGGNGRHDQ